MTAVVVVVRDEGVEQGLQRGDGGGLDRLGGEPLLHRGLEAFDLALRLGVVRGSVLLHDVQPAQLVLELVASAAAAGVPGGVDHAVVGQDRCGVSVQVAGLVKVSATIGAVMRRCALACTT